MGKIKLYSKTSKITKVDITYGDEQFVFDMSDELRIDREKINSEIKEQPSSYLFLVMLYEKLLNEADIAEADMENVYSRIYKTYKERINESTGRVYDKEYTEHIANASPKYQRAKDKFLKLKGQVGILRACVKSYEQRAFLIQTLSANIRKES